EQFEVLDDCMSFPNLLVRVMRHRRCRIDYRDMDWVEHSVELEGDLSELLQHEYDHLNGILATMRAVDSRAFVMKRACS
ncbi:MAG TPA: formylmethionine deformylase, partial [Synergistaceae bacterium]|nr:formylmethionine deformylase [Synergistaceae bacterium]